MFYMDSQCQSSGVASATDQQRRATVTKAAPPAAGMPARPSVTAAPRVSVSVAAAAPAAPALPSPWQEHMDEASGRPYFFNPLTQETTWNSPAAAVNAGATPAPAAAAAPRLSVLGPLPSEVVAQAAIAVRVSAGYALLPLV